jgi:putative two-component system response regulator
LTGEAPYPFRANIGLALQSLQEEPPRRLSELRPDAPPELDALVASMLERDSSLRPTPLAVSTALTPLTVPPRPSGVRTVTPGHLLRRKDAVRQRVLLVSADPARRQMRSAIESLGCLCLEVPDTHTALEAAHRMTLDVAVIDLPGAEALELGGKLREVDTALYLKVIVVSPEGSPVEALPRGVDDYLNRPFDLRQLQARALQALRVKEEQDRTRALAEQFQQSTRQLEQSLEASKTDVRQAHDAILFAMAKMAESRDGETPGHLRRLQRYATLLAKEASRERPWAGLVDGRFLSQLERCVVLHDIGKIGLPDDILLKPAALTDEERRLVQTHPLIGDRILECLASEHGSAFDFLVMARGIVRHHHERFDGSGYPEGLIGEGIPPAARLTALADVYDALRRERLHKPALPHARAVAIILKSTGQFDPTLVTAFATCHAEFERIYREVGD